MKYLLKSIKYFIALCILCLGVMWLNQQFGFAQLSMEETFYVMFHTTRGMLLPFVMIVAAAFYPKFGFITRRVEGDIEEHRLQILNTMKDLGFELMKEEDEVLFFRATSPLRKLIYLYEDEIKVSQYGQWIEIEGIRRGVAKIVYRLDPILERLGRHE